MFRVTCGQRANPNRDVYFRVSSRPLVVVKLINYMIL